MRYLNSLIISVFLLSSGLTFATTPQIHNTAGLAYYYQGKYAQAFEEFLSALRKDPNNVVAHFNMGRIFERQGKLKDAFVQYQRTLSLDPGHEAARLGYQRLIRFREKVKLRVQSEDEVLEEKIKKNDIRSEAAKDQLLSKRKRQIERHFAKKNYRSALDVTERTLRVFPNSGDLYFYLGRYYFIEEEYSRSVDELKKALKFGVSEEDVVYYLMALDFDNLGDYRRAEAALRRAIDRAPSNSVYYDRLGDILRKQGKDDGAFSEFNEGIKVNPSSVDTRVKLNKLSKELSLRTYHNGRLAFEQRDYPKAQQLLERATKYGQLKQEDLENAKMYLKITEHWLSKDRKIKRVQEVQRKKTLNIKHEEKVSFDDAVTYPDVYLGRYVQWRGRVIHIKERRKHYEVLIDLKKSDEFQEDLEMRHWLLLWIDGKRPSDMRLSYLSDAVFEGKYKDWKVLKNPWNGQFSMRRQPVIYMTEGKFSNPNYGSGHVRVFPEIDYKD